ncbi:Breast carcinoma amplified sequence 2 [Botryosphaeria dothidea]|uniref:Breast carcinoma amplified sequence 2 n=1 Tax=Botryosphaeria dothidea TaxID=55169 RepID=A0A8H4IQH2_9PEZI|nr:Breast carcinoma amplified sequence 2 [Botryosphaeria dothidea]KAF4305326.1 Breast carcinoma amplified sequence 2 [Botryosphaeria dothidea]
MPLIHESHDSLPYVDVPLTDTDRRTAAALIAAELDPSSTAHQLHPSIPASYEPSFPPLVAGEHARLAAGAPKDAGTGVDLSRYEALDAPVDSADPAAWRSTLRAAYTSSAFLSARLTNLSLLERYGKNAWLVSNAQLEAILRDLEADLARARDEIEAVEQARRTAQAAAAPEMGLLEEGWRTGVKKVVETEAAAEGLRRQILERKRAMAQQQ